MFMFIGGGGRKTERLVKPGAAGQKGKSLQAAFFFSAHKNFFLPLAGCERLHLFVIALPLTFVCSPSFG